MSLDPRIQKYKQEEKAAKEAKKKEKEEASKRAEEAAKKVEMTFTKLFITVVKDDGKKIPWCKRCGYAKRTCSTNVVCRSHYS